MGATRGISAGGAPTEIVFTDRHHDGSVSAVSMTLYLWKTPVTDDPDEAARLIDERDERGDDSAFAPSADIPKVAEELLRRFPDEGAGPWADGPPEASDRLLYITLRWSADSAVLHAIDELAEAYGLVVYNPQGPDVGIPTDSEPESPPGLLDHLKVAGIGLTGASIFALGWWIDVPVLEWILMIVGGFVASVALFIEFMFFFGPKEDENR